MFLVKTNTSTAQSFALIFSIFFWVCSVGRVLIGRRLLFSGKMWRSLTAAHSSNWLPIVDIPWRHKGIPDLVCKFKNLLLFIEQVNILLNSWGAKIIIYDGFLNNTLFLSDFDKVWDFWNLIHGNFQCMFDRPNAKDSKSRSAVILFPVYCFYSNFECLKASNSLIYS